MQQTMALTGRPVTMASRGMVAAPHYLAAEAGVWALQQGGNAVDAAVAANLVLAVVYPHMAGLGGDAFLMVWHPGREEPICLNGSGHSGYGATVQFYRDRGHDRVPARGVLAANTVPGAVAAWGDAHARWGALPWEQLFEPASHYAQSGFAVTANLAAWLARSRAVLERNDGAAAIYLQGGQPYAEGQVLVQRDLAEALETLADDGPAAFYTGDLAEEMVDYLEGHGGLLGEQDFADHHSDWVDPLRTAYRGRTVYELPPNTQGVSALLILNLLGGYDVEAMGSSTPQYIHTLVEAAKVALADLDGRIADPSYAALPLERLLAPEYAGQRRALILPERARPLAEYAAEALLQPELCPRTPEPTSATAYIAAADAGGLAVSLVQSLHAEFGSGVVAGRTGVLLHNSGATFDLQPESANRLEPHKRPFQAPIPGLACAGGRPWLLFGASGGLGAPQTHAALLTRMIDLGYNVQQAIEAPRWLYGRAAEAEPEALYAEGRLPDAVLRPLQEMGHEVKVVGDWSDLMGQAQGIVLDAEHGVYHGGADPRGDGQAIGW